MAAPITVLVPRQADQALDGVDASEESLGGHVGEVLAERVAGTVPVTEDRTDGDVALAGDQGPQRGDCCAKSRMWQG